MFPGSERVQIFQIQRYRHKKKNCEINQTSFAKYTYRSLEITNFYF